VFVGLALGGLTGEGDFSACSGEETMFCELKLASDMSREDMGFKEIWILGLLAEEEDEAVAGLTAIGTGADAS